jgi:hypothetical protein
MKAADLGMRMYWTHGIYPGFYAVLGKRMRLQSNGEFRWHGYARFMMRGRPIKASRPEYQSYYDRHFLKTYKPMGHLDDMESLTGRSKA